MNKLRYCIFILAGVTILLLAAIGLVRAGVLTPPQVLALQPDPGSHNVDVGSSVSITYDQDMNPATVDPQSFAVHARQTGWLTETINVVSGTIILDPPGPFHAGELVQVSATTSTLSLGGEAPLAPTVWQFNTALWGGNAAFHENQAFGDDIYSRYAAVGDLDGDGDLDAITTNCGGRTRVYHNDGSGTFTEVQNFDHLAYCMVDAELGDLDGDLDAVVIDTGSNGSKVLMNQGDGTFIDSGQSLWSSNDCYAKLGDLDGDGDLDLFVAAGGFGVGTLRVWKNGGHGDFTLASDFDTAYNHIDVALGDLDGDGDLDAFTTGWNYTFNKVWLNDGTGNFSEAQAITNANTYGVQLGDLDDDGDLDAYLANSGVNFSDLPDQVWLNDGTGHFTDSGQRLDTVNSPYPALGDLDADGDLDVYLPGEVNVAQPDEVWANDGTGTFTYFRTVDENYPGGGVTLGDLDGDGNLDAFVWGHNVAADGFQVYLNGDWTRAERLLRGTSLAATIQCPDDPNTFYLLGGYDENFQPSNRFFKYDAVLNEWTELDALQADYSNTASAVCYQGRIYAASEYDLAIYNIATHTWIPGPPAPRFISSSGMGAWNGSLYVVGGYNNAGGPDGRISRYDIAAQTWAPIPIGIMPNPMWYAGWAQVGPYLYSAGGTKGGINDIAETYRYDMSTNTWQQGPDLASPRSGTSLAVTGSRLYALGGGEINALDGLDEYIFYDEVYYQELSTWPNLGWTEFDDPLPLAYGGMSSACTEAFTGGEIWSAGGSYVDDLGNIIVLDSNFYYPAEPCLGSDFDFELEPSSLAGEALRGGSVTYALTVTNTGDLPDVYDISASAAWTTTFSSLETLWPGESASMLVTVTVPVEAQVGELDTALITVTSQGDSMVWDTALITTTAITFWTEASPIPQTNCCQAVVQCPDDPHGFYLIGGETGSLEDSNKVFYFNAQVNNWNTLADLPAAVLGPAVACTQGKIYVAGGFSWESSQPSHDLYVYDIFQNVWTQKADLPRYVNGGALGAWNGRLYLAGGTPGLVIPAVNQVDIYNIAFNMWASLPGVMPAAASFAGYLQAGPYLYMAGGFSDDLYNNVAVMQRLDMSAGSLNAWEVGPFASARAGFALAITQDFLYASGGDVTGDGDNVNPTDLVEVYDLTQWPGDAWSNLIDPLPHVLSGNSGACTEDFTGGEVWSIGGLYDEAPNFYLVDTNQYYAAEPCLLGSWDLNLAPDSQAGSGLPGESVIYTLTITNTGDIPDAYDVAIDSDWDTTAAPIEPLWPGESVEVLITVTVPADAKADEHNIAVITVTSQGDAEQVDEATLTTTAEPVFGVELAAEDTALFGFPGKVVTYTLHLTNTGNLTDTFEVSLEGNLWEVTLPVTSTMLAAGETTDVIVTVTLAGSARPGEADTVTITATSQGDPGQSAQVELTTTADFVEVYLPVIRK